MPTSYTRSVKTGKGQRMVYNTSSTGKTTRTAVRRTNLGGGQYLTTRFTENKTPTYKSSPKTRSTSRNKRSSSGDGGATLVFGLFVALIAGATWLISKLYTWFRARSKKPE